ncbi:hypothetical protein C4D60_Mb01t00080 [Musa balbisiana]|uniref:Uncharacterized protein n=1 Tax=Musa balbisiana TaxID=52838 RepID=A0A4S8JIR1_MUSBA|nr:hypothetical protein C4D60_Mb01t00080 [Musa balbisiana]
MPLTHSTRECASYPATRDTSTHLHPPNQLGQPYPSPLSHRVNHVPEGSSIVCLPWKAAPNPHTAFTRRNSLPHI